MTMGIPVRSLVLLLSLSWTASAASVSLAPSKDNILIQWSPTTPGANPHLSNALGDMFVGRTNQAAAISVRRGLIAFDIAGSIPSGSTITGVSLTFRETTGLNGDPIVSLHRTLEDWGEGTSFQGGGMGAPATDGDATWLYTFYNAANPGASPTWTTPGGNFSQSASGATIVSDDLGGGQLFTWTGAGMVADVQDWLNNPGGNFGWTVIGDETRGQSAKRLNSGESTALPNVPPVLLVTYVPEPSGALLVVFGIGCLMVQRVRRKPAA